MAYYGGLKGILTGLTKSADHPSKAAAKSPAHCFTYCLGPGTGSRLSFCEVSPASEVPMTARDWTSFCRSADVAPGARTCLASMYVCIYVCMNARMYVCMPACMNECTYLCMYACMHAV